ncbi:hypothetical protein MTP99_014488 [Tenebrio molitor]|nr:hypothetical protein MTP99_014488 [Tenebrio molitor]
MTTTMWKAVALFLLLQNHLSSARHRDADLFDLTVLHMNDFHARFEETNDEGGTCKTEECIGGFSRLYDVINNALTQNPDSILLNGGDNFQGTLWYNIFKWNVTQTFLNELPFDAIVLGNHEFDDGIKGVVPFIKNLKAPVIVSNIDDSLEPDIQNIYQKSVVVERNGKKIGIIGVIIKTANEISSTENLKFFDESESVNAEAERLAKEENVFTNIVLSHSGYDVEQQIAKKATAASKIGLIVGGHSHTFLYTGEPVPGPATPAGPYPTIVERVDGKQVLVVQASCYCRYLGNITVSYDENGDCVDWSGTPYFLDTETPQDETINQEMQPWKDEIDAVGTKVIGKTLVKLDQTTCRYSECLLGNFVADAMVYGYTEQAEDDSSWTYASLAVYNTGGLRTTIEKGDITYNDMVTAQPFGNTFDVGEIEGQYIKEMFEVTMTPYSYGRAYADVNLLQISGFHVVGNLSQPAGSRIESLKVRCNECTVPIYEDLDLDKTYRLIVPSFLKTGGDGFNVIAENLKNVKVGRVDIDVYLDYLEAKSPIFEEVEGRIQFEETNDEGGTCKSEECIGGFSRVYEVISEALAQHPDSVLLNGGDNFQGTLWYNLFKWNVTQYFLNKLPFDAVVLGNHEFDDGIKGAVPFIKSLKAPVIVSNINDTLEPDIQNVYQKSVVIERNGKKIGIIGVIVKTANEISNTEQLKFFDESESVNAEAERLVKEENVFTNVVLSHSGYDTEQEIAKKATAASKIGLVVGGHSHTFLYTGEPAPGPATPAGPYPTIVERVDGKQVLVVQASCYCRYLGNITVSYDENGDCVDWSGSPIFLDTSVPQDETINQEMEPWKDEVDELGDKIVGKTLVTLDQTMCRHSECLLGDFVADAMVYSYAELAEESSWTYAALAVVNAGNLRTTIETGDITYNDMITAQPFGSTFDVGEIEGKYLKEMFEFTMTPYNYGRAYVDINLLQVSGFRLVYNLTQPSGSRVESIKVRCNDCTIPAYEDLDLNKTYRLIVTSFLKNGGDGYQVLTNNLKNVKVGRVDIDVLLDYLQTRSPVVEEIEGRLQFIGETKIRYKNL